MGRAQNKQAAAAGAAAGFEIFGTRRGTPAVDKQAAARAERVRAALAAVEHAHWERVNGLIEDAGALPYNPEFEQLLDGLCELMLRGGAGDGFAHKAIAALKDLVREWPGPDNRAFQAMTAALSRWLRQSDNVSYEALLALSSVVAVAPGGRADARLTELCEAMAARLEPDLRDAVDAAHRPIRNKASRARIQELHMIVVGLIPHAENDTAASLAQQQPLFAALRRLYDDDLLRSETSAGFRRAAAMRPDVDALAAWRG